MAVKLPDGKIARTQPEQVKKNMDDIESIKSELDIIKEGIASAYKIQGSEDVADLNALEKAEDMNGYVYNMLDAGNLVNEDASTLAVQIGDNVVFVWNGGDWYWDRLAGLVDTSNLCTLDTDQTITGIKTFSYGLKIDDTKLSRSSDFNGIEIENDKNLVLNGTIYPKYNNSRDIGASSYAWKDLYLTGKVDFHTNAGTIHAKEKTITIDTEGYDIIATGVVRPYANNYLDLGRSTYKWKDLYIAGNISDGTNSISVEQLHKIIHHKIVANGLVVNLYSYYNASYAGSNIASLASVAGETVWAMKAYSITNHPDLIVVSDGGLAYFTDTGVFTKYLDPTDTIDSDTFEVF